MKILYDLLTLHSKNGAAEYTRKIFFSLLSKIRKTGRNPPGYRNYNSKNIRLLYYTANLWKKSFAASAFSCKPPASGNR